jgi:hypothetical protein
LNQSAEKEALVDDSAKYQLGERVWVSGTDKSGGELRITANA